MPANVSARLILVEDMSPSIIENLGSSLDIGPEAFEAHLRDSGYDRKGGTADESTPNRKWMRFNSSQFYDSLTWFRPVLPIFPISEGKYKDIWADRNPRLPCLYPECPTKEAHSHRVASRRNILRNRLQLSILKGSERSEALPDGWEERVTIWRRKIADCNFGG